MPDINAAWERACDVVEIMPGDWTIPDAGTWLLTRSAERRRLAPVAAPPLEFGPPRGELTAARSM